MFRVMIHFKLNFVYGMRKRSVLFICFTYENPIILALSAQKIISFSLNYLSICADKSIHRNCVDPFWALSSIVFTFISVRTLIPH